VLGPDITTKHGQQEIRLVGMAKDQWKRELFNWQRRKQVCDAIVPGNGIRETGTFFVRLQLRKW